jgi:hypothetical protein
VGLGYEIDGSFFNHKINCIHFVPNDGRTLQMNLAHSQNDSDYPKPSDLIVPLIKNKQFPKYCSRVPSSPGLTMDSIPKSYEWDIFLKIHISVFCNAKTAIIYVEIKILQKLSQSTSVRSTHFYPSKITQRAQK